MYVLSYFKSSHSLLQARSPYSLKFCPENLNDGTAGCLTLVDIYPVRPWSDATIQHRGRAIIARFISGRAATLSAQHSFFRSLLGIVETAASWGILIGGMLLRRIDRMGMWPMAGRHPCTDLFSCTNAYQMTHSEGFGTTCLSF